VNSRSAVVFFASLITTKNLKVPGVVGVPEILPAVERLRPEGGVLPVLKE
jgi:hypothetical protein